MQRRRSTRSRSQDNEIVNLEINQFGAFSLACITEKIHFDRTSTLFGVQMQTHVAQLISYQTHLDEVHGAAGVAHKSM